MAKLRGEIAQISGGEPSLLERGKKYRSPQENDKPLAFTRFGAGVAEDNFVTMHYRPSRKVGDQFRSAHKLN